MVCKICENESKLLFDSKTTILHRYQIHYYQCVACRFIQTEAPYWLDEAYTSAITSLDIGLVGRNINVSKKLSSLILSYFDKSGTFLDYGGGYGMLVRIMRDLGFDYYRFDTYCENIFAKHFDLEDSVVSRFELVTAFELFEHLEDPVVELEKMLLLSDSIFFSTELIPSRKLDSARDWWYFTPETGQHIALYSEDSLRKLAQKLNCNFYTDSHTLHLITRRKLNPLLFRLALKSKFARIMMKARSQKSLLPKDFDLIKTFISSNEDTF